MENSAPQCPLCLTFIPTGWYCNYHGQSPSPPASYFSQTIESQPSASLPDYVVDPSLSQAEVERSDSSTVFYITTAGSKQNWSQNEARGQDSVSLPERLRTPSRPTQHRNLQQHFASGRHQHQDQAEQFVWNKGVSLSQNGQLLSGLKGTTDIDSAGLGMHLPDERSHQVDQVDKHFLQTAGPTNSPSSQISLGTYIRSGQPWSPFLTPPNQPFGSIGGYHPFNRVDGHSASREGSFPDPASSRASQSSASGSNHEGNWLCPKAGCRKSFKKKGGLSKHLDTHDPNHKDSWKFRCEYCLKPFKYPKDLERHLQTHDRNAPRPHKCEFEGCSYQNTGFARKDHLQRHLRDQHRC